jgi:hypothetical protein
MVATELTREEAAMLEHVIHIHLSERRFEIEDFETRHSGEPPARDLLPSDASYGPRHTKKSRKGSRAISMNVR